MIFFFALGVMVLAPLYFSLSGVEAMASAFLVVLSALLGDDDIFNDCSMVGKLSCPSFSTAAFCLAMLSF